MVRTKKARLSVPILFAKRAETELIRYEPLPLSAEAMEIVRFGEAVVKMQNGKPKG